MSGKNLKIRVTMGHAAAASRSAANEKTVIPTKGEASPSVKNPARYIAAGVALCTLAIAGWLTFSGPEQQPTAQLTTPASNEINTAALGNTAINPNQAMPPAPPLLPEAAAVAAAGATAPKPTSASTATLTPRADATPAKAKSNPPKPATRASTSSKNVKRAILTTKVKQHEPIDRLGTTIKAEAAPRDVFFFTEIVDLKGSSVTHRWKHDGRTVASRKFRLDSNSYRVYSNQRMQPTEKGAWQVEVLDSKGKTLSVADFRFE